MSDKKKVNELKLVIGQREKDEAEVRKIELEKKEYLKQTKKENKDKK